MALKDLLNDFELKDEITNFIDESSTANMSKMHISTIVCQIYFVKTIEQLTKKTIEANTKLAESNDKHSKTMALLTGAIAFAAIVSLAISIF